MRGRRSPEGEAHATEGTRVGARLAAWGGVTMRRMYERGTYGAGETGGEGSRGMCVNVCGWRGLREGSRGMPEGREVGVCVLMCVAGEAGGKGSRGMRVAGEAGGEGSRRVRGARAGGEEQGHGAGA
eukprot:scaffold4268_cov96-Isochrysis_galbana.AAC.1